MNLVVAALVASSFTVVKGEPKVCVIYKGEPITCSQLMLTYNKYAYRNESKGI
jgi:hypothetical protein